MLHHLQTVRNIIAFLLCGIPMAPALAQGGTANAGPDQYFCTPTTSAIMAANAPAPPATGTWTLVSGSCTIVDPADPGTSITDLLVGNNVLKWIVDDGTGSTSIDQVSIFLYDGNGALANAGPDQTLSLPANTATLNGNAVIFPATGTWSVLTGFGVITDTHNPVTTVTGLGLGLNRFIWSVDNGPCGTSSDVVGITVLVTGQETCNNGIDDDGDGLIDLNDPDCPCSTAIIEPGAESYILNPSFEERFCCPNGFVSPFSPPWLDCATGWHQATQATADYFHQCGYAPEGFNLPSPAGEGSVGFFAQPQNYYEYIGRWLTATPGSQPLLANNTYTLSLWISTAIVNDQHTQTVAQGAYVEPFTEPLPLAIFGSTADTNQFPVATTDCIGLMPGWGELGRTSVQLSWDWTRVSITFTPQQDIHSIMIGGACDTPGSLDKRFVIDAANGAEVEMIPYYVIDDLMLTPAADQVLLPVSVSGSFCAGDMELSAAPPAGATDFQWYHNGIALVGASAVVLDSAEVALHGAGTYSFTVAINGGRLAGSTYISGFCDAMNDLCHYAVQVGYVPADSSFVGAVTGDLSHATGSIPQPTCVDSANYMWRDLWYRLDAQADDHLILSLNTDSAMLAGVEVLQGNCSGASLACSTDGTPITLDVDSGMTYRIRVFSLEARSAGDNFELHITLDRTTGIQSIPMGHLPVYPNPGNGNFTFVPSFSAADGSVTVRDMAGRNVFLERTALNAGVPFVISLQRKVKTGVYLLEVEGPAGRHFARLVVQ